MASDVGYTMSTMGWLMFPTGWNDDEGVWASARAATKKQASLRMGSPGK